MITLAFLEASFFTFIIRKLNSFTMKKLLCIVCIAGLFSLIGIRSFAQLHHRYLGVHYEYGASMNLRYGRVNMEKGHYIVEIAVPRYAASALGWKMEPDKVKPVVHGKYFSMRGGRWFQMDNNNSIGFDILWEFDGIATPPDSAETKAWTGYIISPLQLGIAYAHSFGDRASLVVIPSYGYALGKTRNDDGKHHMRMSIESYFEYKIKWWSIYAGVGYAHYPKGLAVTWPYDASFGGPLFSLGLAVETNW